MKKKHVKKNNRPMRCPYCGALVTLRNASEIYHDPSRKDRLYVCNNYPACNTYVGTHPGTTVPLGTLANGDLRNLRIKAHRKFDLIWQTGLMSRDAAYRWLADYFCIRLQDAHIGMCGEYQCRELIRKCDSMLARKQENVA